MNNSALPPAEFEELITAVRPQLHRYVTHMIGSVIDAEDVVQDTLVKAYNSLPLLTSQTNLRGWLFRIAHNKAIDHVRYTNHRPTERLDEQPLVAELDQPLEEKELVSLALSVFLKLAPRQRSCVIFKDVLGYSLAEISELLDATVPEIKASLHRGRTRLRELSKGVESEVPVLDEREQVLLARYVDRFNARDFDTLRTMLAAEVRLDLIGRTRPGGVGGLGLTYFSKYNEQSDWWLRPGLVEGHPAIVVYDLTEDQSQPAYFVLLNWENDKVSLIRDYRYARYVMQDAAITVL
ncbi:MAG TPA: sigma-70 family RNA polymerase sigma factor [Chloroflexia bacterium]|nr:sigma-70 family RNA polymerase sigma factor [Chloroflexia bacterium]